MEVIVDHERGIALDGAPSDLISAITAVGRQLKGQGRAIRAIRVDGRNVPPEELPVLGGRSLEQVGSLEVVSQPIAELVGQSLRELEDVLPELPRACHALAEVFQGNSPAEGYGPFEKLAGVWEAVKAREIQIAGLCGCSLDDIVIGGAPARRLSEELNRYLDEAAAAIQANDCVLLGDLLEYELAPRAESEGQIVAALKQYVQGLPPGP